MEDKYKREFEFVAKPSGDYESFVFAVDKKTFKKIKGIKPSGHDKNDFYKGKYNLYPDSLFMNGLSVEEVLEYLGGGKRSDYKITIKIEEL